MRTDRILGGDTNNDRSLQVSETWTYQCIAVISATTTNVGTVTAKYNTSTVSSTDEAEVTVAVVRPCAGIVSPLRSSDRILLGKRILRKIVLMESKRCASFFTFGWIKCKRSIGQRDCSRRTPVATYLFADDAGQWRRTSRRYYR